jgi:hypothetical protein
VTTTEPSGINVYSPKIRNQSLVRKFLSQGGTGYIAISIFAGTNAVDPDAGTLGLQVYFNDVTAEFPTTSDARGELIITADPSVIQRTDVGMYFCNIGPQLTQYRGVLTAVWTYQVGGVAFTYTDFLQILNEMPFYDSLNDAEKLIIEQVSWMFGDLFDSTEGGPYLIEPFQTHFDAERLAQLERIAVTRFNMTGNPPTDYGVGPGTNTLASQFSQLLVLGTYLEVVRHLRDSYVEIPILQQGNITYEDRTQYSQKWNQIYESDFPEYKASVIMAKRNLLGLSRGSWLVAGGIYGGSALGIFQAGTYASQVRSMRFYPASPAISWGATAH